MKELRLIYELSTALSDHGGLDDALWKVATRVPEGYCYPAEIAARVVLGGRVYSSARHAISTCRQVAAIVVHGAPAGSLEADRLVDSDVPAARYFLREEQEMLTAIADRIAVRVEREQILESLRVSQRRARSLYERLPVATVVLQQRGDDFVLIDHNEAARTLSHGAVRERVGGAVRDLLPGQPELLAALADCVATGAPSRRELEWAGPDGRALLLVISLGHVPPDLVLAHVVDVTHERRLEQRLAQAQKMEVLGRMAGGVAHDFNNLLTVILSYSDVLLRGAGVDDPHHGDLLEIRGAAQRAAAMTRQLLTFSRQQVVDPRIVDLGAQVLELRSMLERLLGDRISLVLALAQGLWSTRIDTSQVDQILLNLVVNARDATAAGGRVVITTANVELGGDEATMLDVSPGPYVALTVHDTGAGIDAVTRARLFEPFFTSKPPGQGTGMGLAIVYGIVRQAGGAIAVESEPGRGATFRVLLPRADAAPTVPARSRGRGGETILLVEDVDAVRRIAQRTLGEAGYHVLTAEHGAEALFVGEHHRGDIDLLLTDVVMPWTGGVELAERFAALYPRARVLFVSGFPERTAQLVQAVGSSAGFLAKPYTPEALLRMVRDLLGDDAS
jgi:signal transduction histidine kinase